MSSIFPRWVNRLPLIIALFAMGGAVGAVGFVWYYFSPRYTDVGYRPIQPVPYSHKLHAGILGMDCRYCHTGVEKGRYATLPPSQTCMNCHKVIRANSERLLPIRTSAADGTPVPWVRIHKLPDYVRFSHAAHINAGVGCVNCHGRIDQMEVVHQAKPLSMGWCLECHRNPAGAIGPKDKITDLAYTPNPAEGLTRMKQNKIQPPENCSACHY